MAKRIPLFSTTLDTVAAARGNLINSVDARIAWEVSGTSDDWESIVEFLSGFKNRVRKCDAYALGFLAANPLDFENIFLSHRRSNAMMNVYSFDKCLATARCLNGGELRGDVSIDETIAGVVLAMARGETRQKELGFCLNDYMNRDGKRGSYSSGATQTSSTIRALEAFGIVRKSSATTVHIADAGRFERMLDAAHGRFVTDDDAMPMWDTDAADVITPDTDAFDGVTIDGEIVPFGMLALSAPDVHPSDVTGDAPAPALPIVGEMLLLSAPIPGDAAPAPAKAKRGKRKAA